MSRKMKGFADYFMQGLQMGGQWANQWESRAIERERNKLKAQSDRTREAREDKKLALYGTSVQANAELARARAHRALNPVARGGGGGKADPLANPGLDALSAKWAARDGFVAPRSQQQGGGGTTNNYYGGDGDGGGDGQAVPMPGAEATDGGGTNDYAEGGIVEGMSLQEAERYSPEFTPSSKPRQSSAPSGGGGGALGGAMIKNVYAGVDAYKKARADKAKQVKPTGPQGSGEGGKYTIADSQPGGALSTEVPPVYRAGGAVRNPPRRDPYIVREPAEDDRGPARPENDTGDLGNFRRGGRVRGYADGGAVQSDDLTQGYNWRAAEQAREDRSQQQQTEQVAQQAQQQTEEAEKKKKSSGDTGGLSGGSGMNFDFGSADGATGSGGDSTGGVSGTGGVGGSATDGSGGSAAAGTSGDAGSDGGGTYRRGGRVRRFQSGGRVMRDDSAIDTGTSGPGSGYGYRAAPPSRRY